MKPEFDGFMLYNRNATGAIGMLAVGPKGNVYLFHHDATILQSHWGSKKIKIVDRDGKHVRALTPFPADMDAAKIKALGPFKDADGDLVPRVHHLRRLSVYPKPAHKFPGHSMPAVDADGRVYWLTLGPALACVAADGSVPYDTMVGPKLLTSIKDLRMANGYMLRLDTPVLAMSGDGKYIYFAGLWTGKFNKKDTYKPLPCVFRVDVATRGKAEVFLGKLDSPGKEKGQLTAPRGLAVAKGLIYVADAGADRVVVFKEADKSYVGEIKVKNPQLVGVDPASGAVYVCIYIDMPNADLVKFDGWKTGKELYRFKLPKTGLNPNTGTHRIAVDASKKPVRIWMPTIPYARPAATLRCIVDDGTKFTDQGDPRDLKEKWAEGPRDMTLDRKRDELYVKVNHQKWFRIDEKTGKVKNMVDMSRIHKYGLYMSNKGTQMVVKPDGNLVSLNWKFGLIHHDPTGKPANWPGREKDNIPYGGIMSFMQRHLAVPRDEEIYVALPPGYRVKKGTKLPHKYTSVDVLSTDGETKRTVIWQVAHGVILRVDSKGNIYVAEPIKLPGRSYPEFFDGKLERPKRNLTPGESGDVFWNSYMYGSIVKFPPEGGAIWYDKQKRPSLSAKGKPPAELLAKPAIKTIAHLVYAVKAPVEIQGAEWYRFGFAPYAMHSGSDTCMCEGAGFDIDEYGRVFYPNLGQFRIEMVDAANNVIGHFGKYGNQDSMGKGVEDSLVTKPEIPMAWPITCVASDTHVYVGDTVNRRVVKVRLDYAASETCSIQ
jgi:hypothetical protein